MEMIIGIAIFALAVTVLAYKLYTGEKKNEELLRSMSYNREKLNK
jgi:hypothetical protein